VRRFAYCAAVAAAALTATSGCGGNNSGDDTAASASSPPATTSALAAAYTNTINAGSAALTFTGDVTEGTAVTHVNGKGQVSFKPPASTVTYTGKGTTNEIRSIGDTTYVRIAGKGWSKIDTSTMTGGDASSNTTPTMGLAFLGGATAASPIGTTTIRGDNATGYRVTVDLNKVADAQRTPAEQQIYRSLAKVTGATTLPVDVWLDSHQRVTRERYSVSFAGSGKGSGTKTSTTMDLYDFGSPVKVTPPPHSQVTGTAGPK
jgi:hypothetical protein